MPGFSPRQRAILRATVLENDLIPDEAKQGLKRNTKQIDLLVSEDREVLFGGAAGGGKSYGGLMYASQYLNDPKYSALILRRTFKMLDKSDSIYSLAKSWWEGRRDVHHNASKYTFIFPSGAKIEFGHMQSEKNKFDYQGGAYRCVVYDELTQFLEPMYTYLFSRQRKSADSNLPIRMLATANPGGVGHAWVKKRFIDPKTRLPRTRFIPSKLSDNGNLDQASYIEGLNELDPLTRDQLLRGNWDAVEGGRFKSEWFRYYDRKGEFIEMPGPQWFKPSSRPLFFTIDTAASEVTTADYTVISVWCLSPRGDLVLLDVIRFQSEVPEVLERIKRAVLRWKPQFVGIEEVGAHSGKAIGQLLRRSTAPAIAVKSLTPNSQDKLMRATAAICLAHDGRLWLPSRHTVPTFPHDDVENELTTFTGIEDSHDDIVDTVAYAASLLPHLGSSSIVGGPTASFGGLPALQSPGTLKSAPGSSPVRSLSAPGKSAFGVGKPVGW